MHALPPTHTDTVAMGMGLEVERSQFAPEDFEKFTARVHEELEAMAAVLRRPGFGRGPGSLGAELEMHLVDDQMRPAPCNMEVREAAEDPRVTLELNRYNLEFNALPLALAGRPFAAMREQFDEGLAGLRRAAASKGAHVAMMGTLPTLRPEHLGHASRTPLDRYAALSDQLRALRGEDFELWINGDDPLNLSSADVTPEGACTSWQLHLRVDPEDFASHYNAAQLATGPVLAVSGNAPFFLGHRLWEETRVAVFKQSVDPRAGETDGWRRPPRVGLGSGWVRKGALELFRENVAVHAPLLPLCEKEGPAAALATGKVPPLAAMRLHHGTVWSWNRAVFDPGGDSHDAHLRIELRAMAAGPTVVDMLANSAFALGLTIALAPMADRWMPRMPFEAARHNLYRGAQLGLASELLWPTGAGVSPRAQRPVELLDTWLELAADGLQAVGIEAEDYEGLLGIIEARVRGGQTGARWQRARFDAEGGADNREEALTKMLAAYLERSWSGTPVHEWD